MEHKGYVSIQKIDHFAHISILYLDMSDVLTQQFVKSIHTSFKEKIMPLTVGCWMYSYKPAQVQRSGNMLLKINPIKSKCVWNLLGIVEQTNRGALVIETSSTFTSTITLEDFYVQKDTCPPLYLDILWKETQSRVHMVASHS
jgi:hypothetical protein